MHKIYFFVLVLIYAASATAGDAEIQNQSAKAHVLLTRLNKPAHQRYPASKVDMTLTRVSRHVYYVKGAPGTATENEGFISNAGVVVTKQGVVLFDSLGTPSLAQQLLAKIRHLTEQPVVMVIVSHYHADHVYGLQIFKDLGAKIIAGAGVEHYLQSDVAQQRLTERRKSLKPWVNQSTRLIPPDQIISKTTTLTLGNVDFKLRPVGKNHSPGDLTLEVIPDRVLLVGDLMFEQRLPFVVGGDTGKWLHTLNTMELADIKAVIPGHGPASTRPKSAFDDTRAYLTFLRTNMGKAVNNLIPFDEAYHIDWDRFKQLKAFKEANRQNAYSVYLSMEAESMSAN